MCFVYSVTLLIEARPVLLIQLKFQAAVLGVVHPTADMPLQMLCGWVKVSDLFGMWEHPTVQTHNPYSFGQTILTPKSMQQQRGIYTLWLMATAADVRARVRV
jgi:hypothetical protein